MLSMDTFIIRRNMEDELYNVTVVDVYDQAAGIGKEFEKLIDSYGVEAVTDLMPKVIRSLEQLEALACRNEKEFDEISELRLKVDKLENEKSEKAQERARFEEELEHIEASWQSEVKDLFQSVAKLQEENRKLKTTLHEHEQLVLSEVTAANKKAEDEEIKVLTKLKESVDKQKEELRKVRRDYKQKSVDCDALQYQLERLAKVNVDLRRKNSSQRKRALTLMEEKADLEAKLQDKEQQISSIQSTINDEDFVDKAEPTKRLTRISESSDFDESATDVHTEDIIPGEIGELDMAHLEEKLKVLGKMVIDLQDPNRPRFTLAELRQVLLERNELKTKLIEVEEELSLYRPSDDEFDFLSKDEFEPIVAKRQQIAELVDPTSSIPNGDTDSIHSNSSELSNYHGEDDPPVQGPIYKEPDEKLYPDRPRESGIRKFFSFVFGSPSESSQKHRHQKKK